MKRYFGHNVPTADGRPTTHHATRVSARVAALCAARTARLSAARFALFAAIVGLTLAAAGCKEVRYTAIDDAPVTFETLIGNRSADVIETRVSATGPTSADWDEGDVIGVFMVAGGGTVADHSLARNVPHSHTGGGAFEVTMEGDALLYPRAGSVDFAAYYPWRARIDGHLCPIDVGGRCDLRAMDFMYSDNAAGHSAGEVPLLRFRHRLSKIAFNVTDAAGTSLDSLAAVISGPRTRGTFDLSAGTLAVDEAWAESIIAATVDDGDGDNATARLEAIVMPCAVVAPTVDFALPDGSTARLVLTRSVWREGNIYLYNVRITDGGAVELDGGTVIDDWDDQDTPPTDHEIDKQKPDDGSGTPDDPDDPDAPGKVALYFSEGFGSGGTAEGLAVGAYAGWENGPPVSFAERFEGDGKGGARVCLAEGLGTHIVFPAGANADFSISGLPAGRSEITLGYDVAAGKGGTGANMLRVYAGGENLTSQVTTLIPSPNRYVRVFVTVPSGATSLRFVADGVANTHGMRLDNVRLEGKKR